MANVPTLKVEIAFVSAPLDIAPTWVDVSADVRRQPGVTVRRGRQSELSNFDAGVASVTLSNRARKYDPSYSSGPYFGNLLPRKQIRITATWSAVDYVMFTGWVTGWPQTFAGPHGKDATVTLQAIDGLAWLSENNLPNDLVYSYAHDTIGSLALFLRGADPSTWYDATGAGISASPILGTGQVGSGLAKGSTSPSVTFGGATVWRLATDWVAAGAWSIAFWFQTTTAVDESITGGGYVTGTTFSIGVNTSGALHVAMDGVDVPHTAVIVNDGNPHHVVLTGDIVNGLQSLYVDGVLRSTASPGAFAGLQFNVVGVDAVRDYTGVTLFQGAVGDIAVFTKQLSAAEVVAFFQRSYGSLYESSTERVTRILDDVGWPATWRSLTTTPEAIVGELVYNSAKANTKLLEVQNSEQGRIFAGKDGKIVFLSRYYAQEVTVGNTVQQIFSDDGGATALPYSTFGFEPTDLDMANQATVTAPAIYAYASSNDATSISTYGLQSVKVNTILTSFNDANNMAKGLVAQGKVVNYRAVPITVYPVKNTSRWANVLGLELGHRISMENTPMQLGSQQVQELTLEQIEWGIVGDFWTLQVGGSPVHDVWFIVGSSLVGGPDLIGY